MLTYLMRNTSPRLMSHPTTLLFSQKTHRATCELLLGTHYLSKMRVKPVYMPKELRSKVDVLLKLESGHILPAHTEVLAHFLPVIEEMVKDGCLSKASPKNVVTVSMCNASLQQATLFLQLLYDGSHQYSKHITKDTALSIARLSHNYGSQV